MGKYKKYINLIYLVIFVAMVVIAYTTSKYRPESVTLLFTDPSWLGDWPKWLDFPLMPFLNKWFDILIVKYGICLLYTSPSPRDGLLSRMPSSA